MRLDVVIVPTREGVSAAGTTAERHSQGTWVVRKGFRTVVDVALLCGQEEARTPVSTNQQAGIASLSPPVHSHLQEVSSPGPALECPHFPKNV